MDTGGVALVYCMSRITAFVQPLKIWGCFCCCSLLLRNGGIHPGMEDLQRHVRLNPRNQSLNLCSIELPRCRTRDQKPIPTFLDLGCSKFRPCKTIGAALGK